MIYLKEIIGNNSKRNMEWVCKGVGCITILPGYQGGTEGFQ